MKERPIIFGAESVRAILEGRKTQTRRLILHRDAYLTHHEKCTAAEIRDRESMPLRLRDEDLAGASAWLCEHCRYGAPGDRLWVRETHLIVGGKDSKNPRVVYRATNDGPDAWLSPVWTPSIHMPRWASRLVLEVAEVRVQRLQEISPEDARAEGVESRCQYPWHLSHHVACDVEAFAHAWDSINGKRAPWASNPWVWAITFRRAA